jgi:flagellar hook-associated protein 3 FlgL
MNNNLLLNLNRGLTRLDRINNQLGSKKQINVPSDDPVKAGIILRTSSSIRETDQYLRNIGSAESWLDSSDIVMKDVLAVLHRAKELAVNGSSSHLDNTARQALADEVSQLHSNLVQLANSTHGGRYLFAGQRTDTEPFQGGDVSDTAIAPVIYHGGQGDELELNFAIGVGVELDVNMDARELFVGSDGDGGIFGALRDLYDDLVKTNGDDPGDPVSGDVLQDLDLALDAVLQGVSKLGGKQNRVELAKERLLDLQLNLTKILSEEQDLDYAEAIMELKMEEFAYRTALSVGARIIQPSLVDFLR